MADDGDYQVTREILVRLDAEEERILLSHRWIPESCVRCRPEIGLRDSMAEWGHCIQVSGGYWIELRRDLIFEHSWFAVLDVLLHELAHFLVMYLHPGLDEGPHGKTFRELCGRLGGNARTSGEYAPLDQALLLDERSEESQASPMEVKIGKLLALSESPNEHEAHLALCKARELMARHGLAGVSDESDPYVTADIAMPGKRIAREEVSLMCILSDYYGVRCLSDYGWGIAGERVVEHGVVSVSGRRSKVKVALYVRDYVWRCVDEWWRRHGGGVRLRRDYALGFLSGMRAALARQESSDGSQWGLVRLGDAGLDEYFRARYPRVRNRRCHSVHVDRSVTGAGYAAGLELKIRQGVGGGGAVPRLLEGHGG